MAFYVIKVDEIHWRRVLIVRDMILHQELDVGR